MNSKTTKPDNQSSQQPSQPALATDCAVFIGLIDAAEITGPPPAQPVMLTDWQAYTQQFGGFVWDQFLAFAVHSFFQSGGTRCYVMPGVASESRPGEMAHADTAAVDGEAQGDRGPRGQVTRPKGTGDTGQARQVEPKGTGK